MARPHTAIAAAPAGTIANNVVAFPRASTLHADLDRAAILRRCRIAARHAGLAGTNNGVELVEAHAAGMLDGKAKPREVVDGAERYAARLAAERANNAPGAA